jgi:hypothetical protein
VTTDSLPDRGRHDQAGPLQPVTWRRRALTWALCVLVPLSLVAVVLVLAQMTSAAAATGGCGGG